MWVSHAAIASASRQGRSGSSATSGSEAHMAPACSTRGKRQNFATAPRKVAPGAEGLNRRGERLNGSCNQGADAGDAHEPAGAVVAFGAGGDLSIQRRDLAL